MQFDGAIRFDDLQNLNFLMLIMHTFPNFKNCLMFYSA